jgi:hypothetical protein
MAVLTPSEVPRRTPKLFRRTKGFCENRESMALTAEPFDLTKPGEIPGHFDLSE